MTWQVEHARLASQAPSRPESYLLATYNIFSPISALTYCNEPSLSLNLKATVENLERGLILVMTRRVFLIICKMSIIIAKVKVGG